MIEIEANNIRLHDSLAIEDVDTLYKNLAEIKNKDACLIIIDKIKEIHMANLQILMSFKKTYPKTKFDIKDNNFQELLKKMGLLKFFI